jgi:hypothetical protein
LIGEEEKADGKLAAPLTFHLKRKHLIWQFDGGKAAPI